MNTANTPAISNNVEDFDIHKLNMMFWKETFVCAANTFKLQEEVRPTQIPHIRGMEETVFNQRFLLLKGKYVLLRKKPLQKISGEEFYGLATSADEFYTSYQYFCQRLKAPKILLGKCIKMLLELQKAESN